MTNDIERRTQRQLERGYAILEKAERQELYRCPVSPFGLPLWDGEGLVDRQLLRRLRHAFVQEPARTIEQVGGFRVQGDETRFIGTVTVPAFLERRITKRKHSHDRNWSEKYRPWYRSVVSNLAVPFEMEDLSSVDWTEESVPGLTVQSSDASFLETLGKGFVITPPLAQTDRQTDQSTV